MDEFAKLLNITDEQFSVEIRGFSATLQGDSDCVCDNCGEGFGACECNCDCADD